MTTDIIEINNFIVLFGISDAKEPEVFECQLDNDAIGITFYGSGQVEMDISHDNFHHTLTGQKGTVFSFFGNKNLAFSQKISPSEPLREVSIFLTRQSIQKLPAHERELYEHHLGSLLACKENFGMGPRILMTPEMQTAIAKIFNTPFEETTRLLFLKSQVIELLSHYFAQLSKKGASEIKQSEIDKIHLAKDIIVQNISKPPSLSELSRLIGTNNNKLKKNFKQIFGVPVFKYLQNERLQKAHQLLSREEMSVQEVAWYVGYESLSSFSNAFYKKYGFRPSKV